MRARLAVLYLSLLPACDQVFRLEPPSVIAPPDGGDPLDATLPGDGRPDAPSTLRCFDDAFSGTNIDVTYWATYGAQVAMSVGTGRLRWSLVDNQPGQFYSGLLSPNVDFTGGSAILEIVEAPRAIAGPEIYFRVQLDQENDYEFSLTGGSLHAGHRQSGGPPVTAIDIKYSADHRYWRFRHDADSNLMHFETGANPQQFEVLTAVSAVLIPVEAVHVEIGAGTYQASPTPGNPAVDNFQLCTTN